MTTDGGATHGRPLCACHGEPMRKNGTKHRGGQKWRCRVEASAAVRAHHHANAASENYARVRRSIRARIVRKRARIQELERQLAEENAH